MTAANRIVKRLANFVTSPVTAVGASGGSEIPANAIKQRDGSAIKDRSGNFIEVRA